VSTGGDGLMAVNSRKPTSPLFNVLRCGPQGNWQKIINYRVGDGHNSAIRARCNYVTSKPRALIRFTRSLAPAKGRRGAGKLRSSGRIATEHHFEIAARPSWFAFEALQAIPVRGWP